MAGVVRVHDIPVIDHDAERRTISANEIASMIDDAKLAVLNIVERSVTMQRLNEEWATTAGSLAVARCMGSIVDQRYRTHSASLA